MASDDMVISLAGNCFFEDRMSQHTDAPFMKVVELLRSSDASLANCEMVIHDREPFPAHVGGGRAASYLAGPPFVAEEMKWMGVNLVIAANNHVTDFAEDGVMTTIKYLKAAGMAFAGIGHDMTSASEPGYLQTAKGRIGLVASSDWGPRGMQDLPYQMPLAMLPADGNSYFNPRPGVNLIRYDTVNIIDRNGMDELRRLSEAWGWEKSKATRRIGGARAEAFLSQKIIGCEQDTDTQFHFMGRKFELGDKFDFRTEPWEEDLERNYKWIREARRCSDIVIAALHDQGARRHQDEEHVKIFARGSIDNGADIFFANGGRQGGVEIYKGKVILYGSSLFYFQNESIRRNPPELMQRYGLDPASTSSEFLETRAKAERVGGTVAGMAKDEFVGGVVQQVVYDKDRKLKEIRIIPIERQSMGPASERGRSIMVEPGTPMSKHILDRAIARSADYGTKIIVENGIGYVRPA